MTSAQTFPNALTSLAMSSSDGSKIAAPKLANRNLVPNSPRSSKASLSSNESQKIVPASIPLCATPLEWQNATALAVCRIADRMYLNLNTVGCVCTLSTGGQNFVRPSPSSFCFADAYSDNLFKPTHSCAT